MYPNTADYPTMMHEESLLFPHGDKKKGKMASQRPLLFSPPKISHYLDRSASDQADRPSPRKTISFKEICHVRIGLSLVDYTEDEIRSSWYNKQEFSRLKKRCCCIVAKILVGKSHRHCVRGLEHLTPDASQTREIMRNEAYRAVLNEQDRQFHLQTNCTEMIAQKYQVVSLHCQRLAQLSGWLDRQAVMGKLLE